MSLQSPIIQSGGWRRRRIVQTFCSAVTALWGGIRAVSPASAATERDEEALWQLEQAFYQHRGQGDLSFYVAHSDPDYAVWAPTWETPHGYKELVESAKSLQGAMKGETIIPEQKLIRVNRARNVALVFYSTHRTTAPGGAPADERFDTLHVWVKGPEGWRLMGGMARPVPEARLRATDKAPVSR